MAGRIRVLPDDLANKIAAGEVIERPASILKELLENAVDAGATDVVVELQRGGCKSIRVIDNGEGIDAEDAALAFSRFATSKIYLFDDIYRVHSFGFRGEALPSIASVSRVEMHTRRRGSLAGTRVVVQAGEIKEVAETGCPAGTSVYVTDIFEPVPVRRKFLRSEHTEQGHCMDVVGRMALANPHLRIRVLGNGREIINLPATEDAGERLAFVLGADFLDSMVPLCGEAEGARLHGFASKPDFTRSGYRHIYCFVNKRFIRDHTINSAIMTAYRRLIEAKRYPVVALMIDMPPQDVDVNVHPAKLEVRFRNPGGVHRMVVDALARALGGCPAHAPSFGPGEFHGGDVPEGRNFRGDAEGALKRYALSFPSRSYASGSTGALHPGLLWIREGGDRQSLIFSELIFLGQVGGAYLVFSGEKGMVIMDQHAAHERVLFEKLKEKAASSRGSQQGQRLLVPEIISLAPRDYVFLEDCLPLLRSCGFEIEPFGRGEAALKCVPLLPGRPDPKRMLLDFLEEFNMQEAASLESRKEDIYAFLACKGAVRAHENVTPEEVKSLCRDLDSIPNASSCPHGRPLFVSYAFSDLEKMFKRR